MRKIVPKYKDFVGRWQRLLCKIANRQGNDEEDKFGSKHYIFSLEDAVQDIFKMQSCITFLMGEVHALCSVLNPFRE